MCKYKVGDKVVVNGDYPQGSDDVVGKATTILALPEPAMGKRYYLCESIGPARWFKEEELDPVRQSWYMVYAKDRGNPTVRHATREKAEAEALRLSTINPDLDFFVLEAVAKVHTTRTIVTDTKWEQL